MRRLRAKGAQRAFGALSAVAFGFLGWLVTHGLKSLFEQHRHDLIETGVQPQGLSYHEALVSMVAGMAIGSLLAIFFLSRQRPGGRGPRLCGTLTLGHRARAASALSTTGFVLAELVERAAVGDHQVPPVTVLLVGVAMHVVVAWVTFVLWRSCVRSVQRLRSKPCPVFEQATVGRAAPDVMAAAQTWFSDRTGRAPPFSNGSPRPTFA